MNFFKSLLLDEEEESSSDLESDQNPNSESPQSNPDQKRSDLDDQQQEEEEETDIDQNPSSMGWNFGGLIKTIATKSESVLQTYRQDLSDFSSGLKIETSIIREVASRVVKELPTTFESGTSVATESLESVGQAIDDFGSSVWRGTAEIVSQGKETLLSNSDFDENSSDNLQQFSTNNLMNSSMNSKKYNRLEAQLYAIQTDLNTYCVNPENLDDFEGWKSGFVLGEKSEEIQSLLNENEVMERVYTRIVPGEVDDGTFWYRYFYRVYKLKQIEDARANLVKRAIEGDEEEDLSWDVDDDEEEVEEEGIKLLVVNDDSVENKELSGNVIDGSRAGNDVESVAEVGGNKDLVVESTSGNVSDEKGVAIEGSSELNSDDLVERVDEKLVIQGKSENGGESGKDSDFSVVSSQPSLPDEEDLSWDEIEDVGDSDENKVSADGRATLAKRLTIADEDEDLSWDIEDEDEETEILISGKQNI